MSCIRARTDLWQSSVSELRKHTKRYILRVLEVTIWRCSNIYELTLKYFHLFNKLLCGVDSDKKVDDIWRSKNICLLIRKIGHSRAGTYTPGAHWQAFMFRYHVVTCPWSAKWLQPWTFGPLRRCTRIIHEWSNMLNNILQNGLWLFSSECRRRGESHIHAQCQSHSAWPQGDFAHLYQLLHAFDFLL